MCRDALVRDESCGCHFREEHVSDDGEVLRNDTDYSHVAAWEWTDENTPNERHQEELTYEVMQPATRSYK